MASGRPWVPWYPADILNDPKYLCLSRAARCTYREILDRMWLEGAALINDERRLAALLSMPLDEFREDWQEIQDPADPCFMIHPDHPDKITNKRLLVEWRKAEGLADRARENGKRGGRPRKDPTDNPEQKTDPVFFGNPEKSYPHPQSHSQSESESQSPEEDLATPDGVARPRPPRTAPANAPPPCPHDAIIALYHEILPELPPVKVWSPPRQALLRSRWREDKTRQNLAWWRDYFERVRGSPFLTGKVKDWRSDLEWLVRPRNLPKVLEGHYEPGSIEDPFAAFVAKAEAAR